jgi:2-polyprenyl-6-methoxyphenol hydroxylase-like FAD-dependent oxidoreductase
MRSAKIVISQHPRRASPQSIDTEIYKWRHLIENFFCKLKEFKRIAMRADKTDQSFAANIHLASAVIYSQQCRTAFITGMYYRDPIDSWSSGRITLLGDAAHPMVPFLAAGAGQSIEDAWTLARVLARRQDDIPGALLEYERRRLPRTTRIQAGARAAVKLVHETDGARLRDRNARWKGMARIDPLAETSWGLAWDYNVVKAVEGAPGEVVNVRPA